MLSSLKKKKQYNFPVIIEKDDSGYFLAKVPGLRGCHTQAKTLPELYKRIDEVIALCLETEEKVLKQKVVQNKFVGIYSYELVR